ncbi:MAG: DUF5681 domain-containing protein [Maricaulis sp.]|nr:DUF5681 domain-containing protein [Maricaulis sp.]
MMEKPNNPRVRHRTRPAPKGATQNTSGSNIGSNPHKPVGYANPPKSTQFKRGKSGNPKGRPKGSKNLSTMIEETLYSKIPIREGGSSRQVTLVEAMLLKQKKLVLEGDIKALDRMFKMAASCQRLNPISDIEIATFDPEEDRVMLEEFAQWHREGANAKSEGDDDD